MNRISMSDPMAGTTEAHVYGFCNRCGGELHHLREDKWICCACGNRAILQGTTFYLDYDEGAELDQNRQE